MESDAAWSAGCREALAAVASTTAVFAGFTAADCPAPFGVGPLVDVDPLRAPDASGGDPVRDLADACLDGLAEVARLEARTAALKIRLAAEYVQASRALVPPGASAQVRAVWEMALVAELACVLTVSERAAGALLSEAQALTSTLPLTLSALQAGTVSFQHARIMVDETASLDADGAAGLEAHFLDPNTPNPARGCPAGDLVPGRFRAKARAWRERHHRDSIEARHTRSAADRRVEYVPDRDGMAWLSAYLPAGTAAGIWERSTAAARALQGPAEPRTLTQLRADLTATWLLTNNGTSTSMASTCMGGTCMGGGVPSPRAQVLITVPVLSLLGATNEPATLDGYGPIPPSMARHLIADGAGSFYRVLTDPRDGAPLEIGRTSYRLTKSQRHWLRLRDGKCPFPGCSNHSLDNEADHLLAWADGGTTGISNLGQPCPKHHRLKHTTTWTPTAASTHHPPGWTAPSGRHYPSEHQDWEPPHLPPTNAATNEDPGWNPPPGEDPDPDDGWGLREAQDQDPEPDEDRELPPAPFPDWHKYLGDPDLLPTPDADVPAWPAPRGPFPEKPAAPQRLIDFSHSTRSCRQENQPVTAGLFSP